MNKITAVSLMWVLGLAIVWTVQERYLVAGVLVMGAVAVLLTEYGVDNK